MAPGRVVEPVLGRAADVTEQLGGPLRVRLQRACLVALVSSRKRVKLFVSLVVGGDRRSGDRSGCGGEAVGERDDELGDAVVAMAVLRAEHGRGGGVDEFSGGVEVLWLGVDGGERGEQIGTQSGWVIIASLG